MTNLRQIRDAYRKDLRDWDKAMVEYEGDSYMEACYQHTLDYVNDELLKLESERAKEVLSFEVNFYIDDFGYPALSVDDYIALTNEQRQELDRNYWRFGGSFSRRVYFDEMVDEEKAMFAGQEMIVG